MSAHSPNTAPLIVRAPAKINLTLDVLGRRTDGFHALRSVMQAVELHDTLELRPAASISLSCDDPTLESDDNLVLRAARALRDATGYAGGAAIALRKRIPVNAGLGGGSSDAAATLLALNGLWQRDLPLTQLAGLGAALGSDAPFFFYAPTALVSGRGEVVERLPDLPGTFVVLHKPPCAISTRQVFGALQPASYGDGAATERLLAALRERVPVHRWPLANDLQETVTRLYPDVADALARLRAAGATNPLMTGSGSTVYALFEHERDARGVHDRLCAGGHVSILTRTT